jgi:hypothetical protein
MASKTLDWTHKRVRIEDIRKLYKLYAICITHPSANPPLQLMAPLFVKDIIFEERLRSYFLKDIYKISREEILNIEWNMYITKGHYIKINEKREIEEFHHDPEKWYISYLEISGPLAYFDSIYYKDKELNKT